MAIKHKRGSPLHRENRENTGNLDILLKHRENTGILFAQALSSLIVKIQDIVIFAEVSFAPETVENFVNWHGGNSQLNREKYREMNRENTGNLKNKNKNKGGGVV